MSKKTDAVVVFTVRLARPGIVRRVASGDVRVRARGVEEALAHDPEESSVRVSKSLLESTEYGEISALDGAIRAFLRSQALPTRLAGGQYLIPLALVERVDERVAAFADERAKLVRRFVLAYPRLVEEARLRLGDLWDATDYASPEAIESAFDLRSSIAALAEPGSGLERFSAALYRRELAKAEKARELMVEEIRSGMRVAMGELVDALLERLRPREVGARTPKIMACHIERLQAFISDFAAKNSGVAEDGRLAELVEKARALVAGVSPERLRASVTVQQSIASGLAGIRRTLDEVISADASVLRGVALELEADARADETPSPWLAGMRRSGLVANKVEQVDLTRKPRVVDDAPSAAAVSPDARPSFEALADVKIRRVDLEEAPTGKRRAVAIERSERAAKLELE